MADASHELRTPLTIIRANADVLAWADAGDPAERAYALADLAGEAARMGGLVDRLLTLARADAGQRLTLRPTPLRPLLEEAHRQARLLAPAQRVALARADEVTVAADPDALKQLLLILVENALKYTSTGVVTLALSRDGDEARFSVADTGIGIAPEDLLRIFERFYRADAARAIGGSGLGLSIARWIAAEHQGRIDVRSAPGRGSAFTVILPARPPVSTCAATNTGWRRRPSGRCPVPSTPTNRAARTIGPMAMTDPTGWKIGGSATVRSGSRTRTAHE